MGVRTCATWSRYTGDILVRPTTASSAGGRPRRVPGTPRTPGLAQWQWLSARGVRLSLLGTPGPRPGTRLNKLRSSRSVNARSDAVSRAGLLRHRRCAGATTQGCVKRRRVTQEVLQGAGRAGTMEIRIRPHCNYSGVLRPAENPRLRHQQLCEIPIGRKRAADSIPAPRQTSSATR